MKINIDGYKTYIVAIVTVLSAILGYSEGTISLVEFIAAILGALGLGAGRHAIAKVERKVTLS